MNKIVPTLMAVLLLSTATPALCGPLHDAAENNDLQQAREMLALGEDVNSRDHADSVPLHYAAEHPKTELMQFLLSHGADVFARNYLEATPLHHAARNPNPAAITMLLDKGADKDINARGWLKQTPLHLAACASNVEVMKVLIKRGADIHALDLEGRTPLQRAVMEGCDKAVIQLLLIKGAVFTRENFQLYLTTNPERDSTYKMLRDAAFRRVAADQQ